MPDPASPLAGARYDGFATIADAGPTGMITLRGDLASPAIARAVKQATGLGIPAQCGVLADARASVLWMSPDEVLLLCAHKDAPAMRDTLVAALDGQHALAVDVSDARAHLTVAGEGAREVLAKLCPVDLSPAAFTPGRLRRTRMAQIAAAVWLDEAGTFHVLCFRSVACYAFDLLSAAARPGGEVGVF